jgi:16S rRNA (guanine527-N7)-methyltransferase
VSQRDGDPIFPAARPALAITGPDDFAESFDVPRETIHRLERYAGLLEEWQAWTNLVASSTLPDLWSRHFADSAQLSLLAPDARLWLDLGAGAGFPGMVVAILKAQEPDFRMHLVESNQRKCRFLAEVADATAAPVEIHNVRIENMPSQALPNPPDIVSARALAPMPRLLDLAAPLFGEQTRGVFMKGRDVDAELAEARQAWQFDAALIPSLTAAESRIVVLSHLGRPAKPSGKAPRQKNSPRRTSHSAKGYTSAKGKRQ